MSVGLSARALRVGYGDVEVLHGADLDVPDAGITVVLGPNGAGKSTLLAALAGLLPLRSGRLSWRGEDISAWTARRRAEAGILLVPERRGVFADLSVAEHLRLFARSAEERDRLGGVLDTFPFLRQRQEQHAGSLSGGEQQMLALSRVLLQEPAVLLLDEVSFGLAPEVTARLFDLVADIGRRCAVVLVEQYVDVALRLADVVYLLERGEVVFAGEPGEPAVAGYGL